MGARMQASKFKQHYSESNPTPDGYIDDLAIYLETEEGKKAIEEHDSHWDECMAIAREHGFITDAAGGAAILCTNEAYMEHNGVAELAKRLRTSDVEMGGDEE